MEDNAICARVLLSPFKREHLFGRFLNNFPWSPFALFQKMWVLGDLAKIAITWPFGHFGSRFFAPKSSPVFALEVHTN